MKTPLLFFLQNLVHNPYQIEERSHDEARKLGRIFYKVC